MDTITFPLYPFICRARFASRKELESIEVSWDPDATGAWNPGTPSDQGVPHFDIPTPEKIEAEAFRRHTEIPA